MPPKRDPHEVLRSRTVATASGCLEWTGYRRGGYGRLTHGGRLVMAHRLAYELAHGPIPAGSKVLHRCDNPPCCNPEHLFLGTQTDNMRDMARKGRGRDQAGENNPRARLTEADVRNVLSRLQAGATQKGEAARLGVSKSLIGAISRGEAWPKVYEDWSGQVKRGEL